MPLATWRQGDFSSLGVPIYDPTNGQSFSAGRIPASRIKPVAQKIQDRFYRCRISVTPSSSLPTTFASPRRGPTILPSTIGPEIQFSAQGAKKITRFVVLFRLARLRGIAGEEYEVHAPFFLEPGFEIAQPRIAQHYQRVVAGTRALAILKFTGLPEEPSIYVQSFPQPR